VPVVTLPFCPDDDDGAGGAVIDLLARRLAG
jgi:hypothetical protein